jgi:hypothetical protein
MKKVFILFLLVIGFGLFAEGLSVNAQTLKKGFPEEYEVIKARAVADWGTNHNMVVYEISKQADALVDVLMIIGDGCDSQLMGESILQWTDDPEWFMEDMDSFMLIPTDWTMVLYEYKKQLEAKNSY